MYDGRGGTIIPKERNAIPRIIGWSGPARSETTALLLLLASHSGINHIYFQPQKTLLRLGAPDFKLFSTDGLICIKEVFGTCRRSLRPLDMLLQAGVPPEKIT